MSEARCPVAHGANSNKEKGNIDWWPKNLNLDSCRSWNHCLTTLLLYSAFGNWIRPRILSRQFKMGTYCIDQYHRFGHR